MRQEVITASLLRRIRQRANLVLVALIGGIFCIFRLSAGPPHPGFLELALPLGLLYADLALSPIPWQWTGNGERQASLGRGFLQALCFNAIWMGAVLFALFLIAGSPGPGPFSHRPPPPQMGPPPMGPRPFSPVFGLGLINVTFAIAFGWVLAGKEATEEKERETSNLLRQSRAKALQNQLEPHVLYNALSSLSELIYEDPLAAEEVITRLAELYRMLTVHGKAERVLLGRERELVEAYLAMEQMRLGERLSVIWDWPGYADEILAPPLFLQPLVENAIKHGISPSDRGGEVVISCARLGSTISLTVKNSGQPLMADTPRGVGLGSIEARLALWTEVMATFSISSVEGWTVAKIQWAPGIRA